LNLISQLHQWMTAIHQMLQFDAKQVALWIGVSGGFEVHD
jgi:hypothetical protein